MFLRAARFCFSDDIEQPPRSLADYECFLAVAFPPLRPAAFFCAMVPPCEASPPEPERWPPCSAASGELAIFAARCLDMPLSFSASYCFSFLTAMILLLGCHDLRRTPAPGATNSRGGGWLSPGSNAAPAGIRRADDRRKHDERRRGSRLRRPPRRASARDRLVDPAPQLASDRLLLCA